MLCCAPQDRIHEHAEEFLDLMSSDDCIFYFCGLKRMYTSVLDMLEVSSNQAGLDVVCWSVRVKIGFVVPAVCDAISSIDRLWLRNVRVWDMCRANINFKSLQAADIILKKGLLLVKLFKLCLSCLLSCSGYGS